MSYSFLFPRKRVAQVGALIALLGFFIGSFLQAHANPSAINYLKSTPDNPWVTIALAGTGNTVDTTYLKSTTGTSAIEYTAPILALVSAGKNPSTYPNTDLVAALKGYATGGQIGDTTTLNDDIFGILALLSAGVPATDPVIADAKSFLLANQNSDGGWGFAVSGSSDTNMTAAGIMALRVLGIPASDSAIQSARAYLINAQNDDGGFPYDPNSNFGTDSDSSSDAWVISAIHALGEDPSTWEGTNGNDPIEHLLSLQTSDGYFEHQPGGGENTFTPVSTAYAVLALSGLSLPTHTLESPLPTVTYRIEGSTETLCSGTTTTQTALTLIEDVAEHCGFTYAIQNTSFGPYLSTIGSDVAEGLSGWMYRTNWEMPSVGAADYIPTPGDDILWYFASFDAGVLRSTLSQQEITSGTSVTITVESLEDAGWTPVEGATVHIGNNEEITDANGQIEVSPEDGAYEIYAEQSGFVRSGKHTLIVGDLPKESVQLSVTIHDGENGSDEDEGDSVIAFSIDLSNVDFGTLSPGSIGTGSVTINNDGLLPISVGSTVEGQSIFTNYLLLDNQAWSIFRKTVNAEESQSVDLTLPVPPTYTTLGTQSGTLIFWASQAE